MLRPALLLPSRGRLSTPRSDHRALTLPLGPATGLSGDYPREVPLQLDKFVLEAPAELARFIASKGSVALDGTSLTVNEVDGVRFGINLIPHTLAVTTWGGKRVGDRINLEIDPLARYVARLLEMRG